ncbi:MAG: hypothetical protein NC820_00995 [Candidatus Omnitrophica bacterium]|nr:hypothetical protein [Candidatus Omnitrophota bacterium]
MINPKVTILNIADTIVRMQSKFPLEQLSKEEEKMLFTERFNNFLYKGEKKPDIFIYVDIVDKLPKICNVKPLFTTYHFQDGSKNWELFKKGGMYIYRCMLEDKRQLMLINRNFDKVNAYLLPKRDKGRVWNSTDIIYDFLQVLLINYFAQRGEGIFVHGMGIKDGNKGGLLFAGNSGCGKTTMARLWHRYSSAMVLNDDRIIVRRLNGNFFIYGSPWHGEFSDYLASRIESAPLKKIFFLHHSPKNNVKEISIKEAFNLLYPAMFPTFWDRKCIERIVSFNLEVVNNVSCFFLGFKNDKKVIRFVRNLERRCNEKNKV